MTGALAVGAAVLVGLRQAKIMAEQTAIANRQVELEVLKLRSDLFDRRVQVYESAHRWLGTILQTAAAPEGDMRREYGRAMDRAKFLFRPQVYARMKELWDLSVRLTLEKGQNEHERAGATFSTRL